MPGGTGGPWANPAGMDEPIIARRPRVQRGLMSLTVRGAMLVVVTVALTLTVIASTLAMIVNPGAFGSAGDAAWWAIVTLATVGYGDVVPTNSAGRMVASIVILVSMAVFPVLTGLLTAALVARAGDQRRREETEEAERRQALLMERIDRLERAVVRGHARGDDTADSD